MKKFIFAFLLLIIATNTFAQKKVTLSGYMRDAQTGEALIAATIYVRDLQLGAQTNTYGFYSVTVPAGMHQVLYTYVGYANQEQSMSLNDNTVFNAALQPNSTLQEVEITSSRKDENVTTTEMGTVSLSVEKIKTLPVIFGEVDILKALQLMPGVCNLQEKGIQAFMFVVAVPTKIWFCWMMQ